MFAEWGGITSESPRRSWSPRRSAVCRLLSMHSAPGQLPVRGSLRVRRDLRCGNARPARAPGLRPRRDRAPRHLGCVRRGLCADAPSTLFGPLGRHGWTRDGRDQCGRDRKNIPGDQRSTAHSPACRQRRFRRAVCSRGRSTPRGARAGNPRHEASSGCLRSGRSSHRRLEIMRRSVSGLRLRSTRSPPRAVASGSCGATTFVEFCVEYESWCCRSRMCCRLLR